MTGSTLDAVDVQYDEFTDLGIAISLVERPAVGSSRDPSQARLPMYLTAAGHHVFAFAGTRLAFFELLRVSRWISILAGVLAILGTFALGRIWFGSRVGALAAMLFAFSTFTLQHGRDALTQGDALTPAAVVLVLLCLEAFERKRTTFYLFCFALSLAIAVGVKFTLVVLIPAVMVYQALTWLGRMGESYPPSRRTGSVAAVPWGYVVLAVGAGVSTLLSWWIAQSSYGSSSGAWEIPLLAKISWILGAGALTLCGIHRHAGTALPARSRIPSVYRWPLSAAWLAILPLTVAASLVICPAHALNPALLDSLFERSGEWDELLTDVWPSLRLYAGLVLLKLGLPFGITTIVALGWAISRAWSNRGLRLSSVILVSLLLQFSLLPLHQPYWLMSAYPLVVITVAAMIEAVWNAAQRRAGQVAVLSWTVFALAWLLNGIYQCYPAYGLYGYEVVGDRWLGEESRGYRKPLVVTNDGSTEAMEWLRTNAPAGALVLSCLDDYHILDYLHESWSLRFALEHCLEFADTPAVGQATNRADFVLLRAVSDFGTPVDTQDPGFVSRFGEQPVHRVVRGQGKYRTTVVEIYRVTRQPSVARHQSASPGVSGRLTRGAPVEVPTSRGAV